ncbi:MAG: hypothetical protein PHQ59_01975 [Candidatus Daviesbacteria bacterium]|nr:hypothetical protein [Candidatus Daviesbacteria bacterium]
MKTNQRLAEKYHCKVSIQVPGEKEVVLADGREKKEPEKKGGRA